MPCGAVGDGDKVGVGVGVGTEQSWGGFSVGVPGRGGIEHEESVSRRFLPLSFLAVSCSGVTS